MLQDPLERAVQQARQVAATEPSNARARRQLGGALIALARARCEKSMQQTGAEALDVPRLYQEAVLHLDAAGRLDPAQAFEAYLYKGVALREQGELNAAHQAFEAACRHRPDDATAGCELAMSFESLGDTKAAVATYRRVIERHPEHAAAHAGLGTALLGAGDFQRGWDEYDWRLKAPDAASARAFAFPVWQGEPLAGRTLLVRSEQGVGDEIMFASCVPDLIAASAHCVIECSRRLAPLFRRSFAQATVFERNLAREPDWSRLPRIDLQVKAGSAPRFLRRRAQDFPGRPYLAPDPAGVTLWRERLGAGRGERLIGLSWSGGLPGTLRAARSLPLSALTPLLRCTNARFVSLELLDRADELAALRARHGIEVMSYKGLAAHIDALAALVSALDLVITVPTAAAHVAGALGVPAWVLAPRVATWRYLGEGEAMPWYASIRVLRGRPHVDLEHFVEDVRGEFERFLAH